MKNISEYPSNLPGGIDEAGRGALAGPVVAACVVFKEHFDIIGLDDSKKLSEKIRDELALEIKATALTWGIGLAWPKLIAKENILEATLVAMIRATHAASIRGGKKPTLLLIDGISKIPQPYFHLYSNIFSALPKQQTIIDGDAKEPVISAASILAKTFRDTLMTQFDKKYPLYLFSKHKGYGSKLHRDLIKEFGACPLHRTTFKSVKPSIEQGSLL